MEDENYIAIAIDELNNPTFEVTKQYLDVMELELDNGIPKVARVDNHLSNDSVAIYFFIKDERFFLVVNLSKTSLPEVEWVWVENGHRVYLTATSDELTHKELSGYTLFHPLSGWSKGDIRKPSQSVYKFSRVSYEPNKNEAFDLEDKLLELLIELEIDKKEIIELSKNSNAYISICRHQYISGNAGIHFDLEIIKRLNELNLEVDIDTYISGKEIE
jgi:hypothetical protein